MSDLRRLDEIVQKVDDKITFKKDLSKPYVGLEHIATKSSYLSGFSEANTSISTNAVFSAGDVLFGKLRPNLRKCVVAPFDGYCSTDILVLRAKSDVCNRFAGRVFQTEKVGSAAEMTAIGTKMPRTSWTHLKEVEVYYPDRHNQEVIANILDTLDTTIRQTEAIIAKLQQVKLGLLHDLLTRGIDANGQLRRPVEQAPHLYKESPLGWIPMEWRTTGLRNELTLQRGFDITVAEQRPGNIPVVSSSGITSFHNQAMVVGPGVVTGRKGKLGNTYYLDGPFWPHDTTLWVKDFHGNQPKFAAIFLHFLRLERFDAATSVPTLNRNFIHPMLVVFPAKREQEKIVFQVETYENRIQAEHAILDKLRALKSALMDDLLTGRMRVTPLLAQVDASR